jgi:hypothetical protein
VLAFRGIMKVPAGRRSRAGILNQWGRKGSTEQAEAERRVEVVQVLVKQLDGAYTPIHS